MWVAQGFARAADACQACLRVQHALGLLRRHVGRIACQGEDFCCEGNERRAHAPRIGIVVNVVAAVGQREAALR